MTAKSDDEGEGGDDESSSETEDSDAEGELKPGVYILQKIKGRGGVLTLLLKKEA